MDRLERAVVNAEEARQLLSNPMLETAFDDTRRGILEAWAQLQTSNKDEAYDLHRMLKMLDRVKKCLQIHVETGKIASKEIEGRNRLIPFRRA